MLIRKSIFFLSMVLIGVLGDGYPTYTPDAYPDSLKELRACRVTDPSLACDPNHILNDVDSREGIELLHRALTNLRGGTNCSCTPEDYPIYGACDYPQTHGYTLSVAVLNKVQDEPIDPSDVKTRQQKVATFGSALRLRLNRGQCADDAFIILSANDSTVWTSVGEVMNRKLTPELIDSVSVVAEDYFIKKQYTEGLLYMIDQYTEVLKGKRITIVKPGTNWPIPLWLVIVIGVAILAVIIGIIVGIVLCCIRKSKSRGYEVGRERYTARM